MRHTLFPALLCLFLTSAAQKRELHYQLSDLPVFLNKQGDTMHRAMLGGLNQPQFQMVDINNDGKKDLVVNDRTGGFLLPFINDGSGDLNRFTYRPVYRKAFPKLENTWFLLVDYDLDGREDLWTRINFKTVLFRNTTRPGDPMVRFEKISENLKAYNFNPPPFPDSSSIAADNFNIPAIGDVDGDGDIDLFSYQATEGNLLLYRNMTKDFNLPLHPPVFDIADFCWGDFRDTTYDGIRLKGCSFKYYRKKHNGGSTLLWLDNDNDGDMDLLMGNAGGKNLVFLRNGKKEFGLTKDSMVAFDGHWPAGQTTVNMNCFPGSFLLDADGDGVRDILVAPNQYEKVYPIDQTGQVWFYKNHGSNALPDFRLEKTGYFTDGIVDHGAYTAPLLRDIDGDQDLDLLIATNGDMGKTNDQAYRIVLYRNIGTTKKPVFQLENEDLWGLSADSMNLLAITTGDLTGDNKPDLLAGNYYGDLLFYKNIGSSSTWAFTTPVRNYLGMEVGESSSPQLIDADRNGLLDLVIGEKDGNFNYFLNKGNTSSPQFELVDDTLGNFIVNEFNYNLNPPSYWYIGNAAGELADLDNDGKLDMVFGGEDGRLRVMKFSDILQPAFTEDTLVLYDSSTGRYNTMDLGARTRPATGDLDGDGVLDLVVGNERGGITFFRGSVKVISISEQLKSGAPAVYPNPVQDQTLRIRKVNPAATRFSLCDASGRVLLESHSEAGFTEHSMNTGHLSPGLYYLSSEVSGGSRYMIRVLIERK